MFSLQLFLLLRGKEVKFTALREIRRVLKKGRILAIRDIVELYFFPKGYGLGQLWIGNIKRALASRDINEEKFPEEVYWGYIGLLGLTRRVLGLELG